VQQGQRAPLAQQALKEQQDQLDLWERLDQPALRVPRDQQVQLVRPD